MKEKIFIELGNICQMNVEAIVNAANTSLLGGGGVDGAIHKAAGPKLLEECKTLDGCAIGQAKITRGYELPAKYVIHAVGPIWRGGARGEPKLLASCYNSCFNLALQHDIKTIAFPAISCGINGYPITQAATIAMTETANFLSLHASSLDKVYFMCIDLGVLEIYQHALEALRDE